MEPADDDRMLLNRYSRGDQRAFEALVTRHGPLVWGVCRRAIPQTALAEDAFQAVFLVLARRGKNLVLSNGLANWLFGVSSRIAKRALRRELRVKQLERAAALRKPPEGGSVESDRAGPEWNEVLRGLDEELCKLPEKFRAPLIACYLQAKTQDEAATELGWSIFKVRRRLGAGRELLRKRLSRRGATFALSLFAGAVFASFGFAAPVPTTLLNSTVSLGGYGTVSSSIATLASGIGTALSWKVAIAALLVLGVPLGLFGLTRLPIGSAEATTPATTPSAETVIATGDVPDAEWCRISGRVVWSGAIPKPVTLNITSDKPACCTEGPVDSTRLRIDPKSRGVANVVVWLRPDSDEREAVFPHAQIHPDLRNPFPVQHVLDQPKCQFEPHIIAARDGDSLLIRNSSGIAHNVNINGCGLKYNRTHSARDDEEDGPLQADRIPAVIRCTIHPWMEGRIRTFDHPYFALTDSEGKFAIPKVPAGRWRVVYWHELGFHKGQAGALGLAMQVLKAEETLRDLELELPP